jgi:beta-glucosidase
MLTLFLCSTDLTLSPASIGTSDNFNVTVTVHNTGSVEGKEVVQVGESLPAIFSVSYYCYFQVYLSAFVSSVVTPVQKLVGFQKINLA